MAATGLIPAHAGKTTFGVPSRRDVRAHPRSRGENSLWFGTDGSTGGSSPLTRGKRTHPVCAARKIGLIPAHAGKTGCGALDVYTERAHPRSRGENAR